MSAGKQCKATDLVVTAKKKMLARLKRERKAVKALDAQTARNNGVHVVRIYKDHPVRSK